MSFQAHGWLGPPDGDAFPGQVTARQWPSSAVSPYTNGDGVSYVVEFESGRVVEAYDQIDLATGMPLASNDCLGFYDEETQKCSHRENVVCWSSDEMNCVGAIHDADHDPMSHVGHMQYWNKDTQSCCKIVTCNIHLSDVYDSERCFSDENLKLPGFETVWNSDKAGCQMCTASNKWDCVTRGAQTFRVGRSDSATMCNTGYGLNAESFYTG